MKALRLMLPLLAIIIAFSGCRKDNPIPNNNNGIVDDIDEMDVPDGFNYQMNKEVDLSLTMPNTIDFTSYHSRFSVFSAPIDEGGEHLLSGTFDHNGSFNGILNVPVTLDQLFVKTLATDSLISIIGGNTPTQSVVLDLSEFYNTPVDTNVFPTGKVANVFPSTSGSAYTSKTQTNLLSNGDFEINDFGIVPNNFFAYTPSETRWQFYENSTGLNPMSWQTDSNNSYVGTGFAETGQWSVSQTFPVSAGDLVTFDVNVKAEQGNGMHTFYSVLARNIHGQGLAHARLQNSFPAYEWTHKTVALTIPAGAIYCSVHAMGGDWTSTGRVVFDNLSVNGILDADGDGVEDALDDYPNDAGKAYNSFYPSETSYGTFAFEDTWPGRGDYDFNDLVVDYQYKQILNADNEIVEVEIDYSFKASGAGYKNGFGFQMDIDPSMIASVTGNTLTENVIVESSNSTEAGQSKTVIIVTDNVFNILTPPGGSTGVNTDPSAPYVLPVSAVINIVFTQPVTTSQTGYPPYNPFMIVNAERGREVHLPGYPPTDLVNGQYFGTQDDDTRLNLGKYYLTDANLPWGINLPNSFAYPVEGEEIVDAYIHFGQWAQSQGFSFMDWYIDNPGYRSDPKIY